MNPIASQRAEAARGGQAGVVDAPAAASGPLLPESGGLEAALLTAQIGLRSARTRVALERADGAQLSRERALADAREATMKAASEEREAGHKGKWLQAFKIAGTVAGVGVGVASVLCSGGATAPAVIALVGVALSASSGYVAERTHNETLGGALCIAGAFMSVGGGLAAAGGTAVGQLSSAEKVALVSAKVAGASVEIGGGVTRAAVEEHLSAALRERAHATDASAVAGARQAEVDEATAIVKELEASARRGVAAVVSILNTRIATASDVLRHGRKA